MTSDGRERSLANLRPFKPGQSGNPGGRSKSEYAIAKAFRAHGEELVGTLLTIIRSPRSRNADKVAAVKVALDRGWGQPKQTVEQTNVDGGKLRDAIDRLPDEAIKALEEGLKAG